jgi:hypothetical protein
MAQTTGDLRDGFEKAQKDAQRGLALDPRFHTLRSNGFLKECLRFLVEIWMDALTGRKRVRNSRLI